MKQAVANSKSKIQTNNYTGGVVEGESFITDHMFNKSTLCWRCTKSFFISERKMRQVGARHNLAVSLARELKGSGITSNVVAPGAIRVKAVEELLTAAASRYGWGTSWEEIEKGAVADIVPNDIGRLGKPEEIAGAVAYLVSPYADYISGATIRVDGGTIRSVA